MRKIRILFFILFACFISISRVSAAKQIECKYVSGHTSYRVIYSLNGQTSNVDKIYKTTDAVKDSDFTELYRSWFDIDLDETSSCPTSIPNSSDPNLSFSSETIISKFPSQCYNYKTENSCKRSGITGQVACLWIENKQLPNDGYCNVDNLLYVGCGGAQDIPMQVPKLIAFAINLFKIATPIILIFIAIITLLKATTAGKEDEMKKATSSLVKKLISAALVFFVTSIVQFIVLKVADTSDKANISTCLSCFLNNDCDVNTYYKTVVNGEDKCTPLTTGLTDDCAVLFPDED